MTYKAPVNDIVFTLNHEAGFDRLVQSGAYPDLSDDLVDAILDEAAKFADNIVAPLSWEGDQTGARLEDDGVKVPESFKEAYAKYVESGWSTLAAPTDYGGQGLPLALSNAVTEMMNSNIGFQLCPMLSNGGMEALAAHASDEQKGNISEQDCFRRMVGDDEFDRTPCRFRCGQYPRPSHAARRWQLSDPWHQNLHYLW